MQLICPACSTPLPKTPTGLVPNVLTCSHCSAEVDVSRAGTAAGRPRFVPEVDRTGDVVAGYRLEERIGAGGMGTVYRALRASPGGAPEPPRAKREGGDAPGGGKPVALKFLSPSLAGEPEIVKRFAREVKMLETLEHPAIVRVIDHGEENGVPWFAMELVEGTDLRARLAKGALTVDEARATFARLLAALGHAHAKGIVHRDLKPANVLLSNEGAKLADFGIARLDPDGGAGSSITRLTETAAIIGSFPYMSPEQRGGGSIDRRSDLFSVGVMLYEALTGRLPQGAFAPPSRLNGTVPPRLDAVVSTLLQFEPAARYPSAMDAAVALEAALRPRPSMRPVLAGGALVAALLALVVPSVMNSGGRDLDTKTLGDTTPVEQQRVIASQAATIQPAAAATATPVVLAATTKSKNSVEVTKTASKIAGDDESKTFANELSLENVAPQNIKSTAINAEGDLQGTSNTPAASNGYGYPANRAESNFVAQIESQAKAPDTEAVAMSTVCNPTLVYDEPSTTSPVVATLPTGTAVARVKIYSQLAGLFGFDFGAGTAAGLPVTSSASTEKKKSVTKPVAKTKIWYLVRAPGESEGWIEQECAQLAAAEKPPQQQKSSPRKK